jgi:lysophospholipase L1-like esterase
VARTHLAESLPWLVLLAVSLLLAGCATIGPAAAHAGTHPLVALGDSVPAGTGCDCTPYPELSAPELSTPEGPTVTVRNDAVAGLTSVGVLDQLDGSSAVINDVRAANLVVVQVGANDVAHTSSCDDNAGCYLSRVPKIEDNLRAVVARVHELTAGHPVDVVLLDYWSVWLGGQYARQQGQSYVDAADIVTDNVNETIRTVAVQTGSGYVDLRAAFKGPDHTYDETHYLSSDGDHPNAAGHQEIASALVAVVKEQGASSSPSP